MTAVEATPAMVVADVEVVSAERLSPSFVRVVLGGPALADVGVDGPLLDQRFKLVVPTEGGVVRRTYTLRALEQDGAAARVVVDIAVHEGGDVGPGAAWALAARPGERATAVLPRRGHEFGGIEWDPPIGSDLLLVGDETAVPAICSILECLPRDARGAAYLEVPHSLDVQDVRRPPGVELTWLVRGRREHGGALQEAVLSHLGTPAASVEEPDDVDPDLWETPTWSSSGEPVDPVPGTAGPQLVGLYAWIAGEAAMVTGLRRHLVQGLGVDRRQVAFMGYWRRGVAMRS